jgi:TonB-dependent SusC/RagA subfamily outer membrane receptor
MNAKMSFIIAGMLLLPMLLPAQNEKILSAKVTEATVFFKGAELVHTATVLLEKGKNEIRIEGLSSNIDVNSLKIKTTNNVLVSSYDFSIDYLSKLKEQTSAQLKNIEDSIKTCKDALDKLNINLKTNANLLDQLQKGITKNVSGSEKGLTLDELMKTMDYFKTKSEQIENQQLSLNEQKAKLEKIIQKLQAQLNQENTKGKETSGILHLTLMAPAAATCSVTVSYFTPSAGWTPYSDITIVSTDKPIAFSQKSKVYQTTGFDWDKVKLTLSTATPSNGKTAPLFSAWFLREQQAMAVRQQDLMVQNSYSYANDEKAASGYPGAAPKIKIRGTASINQDTESPVIIINGNPASQEELNALDPDMIKEMQVLKDATATAIYGSCAVNGVILVTLKSGMDDYVTESDNALNIVYAIDLPYSISGNGKELNIELQTKETTAEYKYYCAPKLDGATYVLAEISDWEKLGLLSGTANVTFEGTYVGATYINTASTHEKLSLTLGTDKRVSVKREKMKDFSVTKLLGNDVQQTFTYKITVKNNQNKKIKMVLKDQYPTSTQKKIEVTLLKETTSWTAKKEDVGVITWEEDFEPGESKTYQMSYSVKYPKEMNLNL